MTGEHVFLQVCDENGREVEAFECATDQGIIVNLWMVDNENGRKLRHTRSITISASGAVSMRVPDIK